MEFITDSTRLVSVFKSLCSAYAHYKWAVAWAGEVSNFNLASVLDKNEKKIDKIIIGLHFCQTSPSFIEKYMSNRNVRFYTQADGTFHSKIYLFYNSNNDWAAVVGSSNFTHHGFNVNKEANILIESIDDGVTFKELSSYIDTLWKEASYFTSAELCRYRKTFEFQSRKINSLKKSSQKKAKGQDVSSIIEVMTWDEYISGIFSTDIDDYEGRLELLSIANIWFKRYKSFNDFPANFKKAIAGFVTSIDEVDNDAINWKMFGNMGGYGMFTSAINNNSKICKALDIIPTDGPISKLQYDTFCNVFTSCIEGGKNPKSCATRLLAIKRPDFFVCINSKNQKELSKLLNIPQSHFSLEKYWDEIIMPIHTSAWFNEKSAAFSEKEKQIKKYQVAMLDSITYKY